MDYNNFKVNDIGPMGTIIKEIILISNSFIVYMDVNDTIQWSSNDNGDFHENFGDIVNQISYWESICNKLFSKNDSYRYKCLLSEAYGRILDEKNKNMANDIIEKTSKTITNHGTQILKQSYLISSFFSTIAVIIIILLVILFKHSIQLKFGSEGYEIFIISLFGGIGSFVFSVLRLKNYVPDIDLSKKIHLIDGCLRVFYGIISGLIVILGIKANLIFGFINNVEINYFAKAFIGIIAGSSEILIPNIIRQIEGNTIK